MRALQFHTDQMRLRDKRREREADAGRGEKGEQLEGAGT